jgi:hypothetical protein
MSALFRGHAKNSRSRYRRDVPLPVRTSPPVLQFNRTSDARRIQRIGFAIFGLALFCVGALLVFGEHTKHPQFQVAFGVFWMFVSCWFFREAVRTKKGSR